MTALDWFQIALAVVLALCGFVMVRSSRTRGEALAPRALPFGAWSPSIPTRYVLGISMLLLAYQLAAYGLPANWVPLRVPEDRFWMLGVGLAVACGLSIGLDFLEGPNRAPDEDLGEGTDDSAA